jgi:hypothetical protein
MCERAAPYGYTNDNIVMWRAILAYDMSMGLARDIEELYVTGDKEEKERN